VEVTSGDARSERTFDGDSCAAVAEAVALTVSLSMTPSRALATVAAAPAQAFGTLAAPPPAPANETLAAQTAASEAAPPADTVPSPPRSRVHGSLSVNAGGLVDVGGVPSPSPGVAVGVAWRAAPVEIRVEATAVEAQRGTVVGSTSGASVSLTAASAAVCLVVPIGDRIVTGPCAGGAVERLAADGFGPAETFVGVQPVVVLPAALGEAELEWSPMSAMSLRASARALAPLSRPTFVVRGPGGGDAYRPAPVDLEPSLGLVVRFGK
jgi:hypothetical protein